MCQKVSCRTCGKPTYAGCGQHIEQVLGNVPRAERCKCREEQAAGGGGTPSFLKRLIGR